MENDVPYIWNTEMIYVVAQWTHMLWRQINLFFLCASFRFCLPMCLILFSPSVSLSIPLFVGPLSVLLSLFSTLCLSPDAKSLCLVDPEAVYLVIRNQYRTHFFPTDKSGLSDNYIFLSISVKGCPFPPILFWSLGFFCWYWLGLSKCTGPF